MRKLVTWVVAGVLALAVLLVGGTWVYINIIRDDPPERLSFETRDEQASTTAAAVTVESSASAAGAGTATTAADAPTTTAATASEAAAGISGTWQATAESQLGYRVQENIAGQSTEGVGRTNAVTGALVIDDTTVTTAEFSVDMTTITSDEDRRDDQFQGRIMDTANFPTATFTLTEPIVLGAVPADLEQVTATATGELTLRGTSQPVTFEVTARRNGANIEVNGAIDIVFEEWGIPNPSVGPVSTDDNGLLEFLLVFAPAA
jgi:polyisoprenoid-binding protein YceI